MKRVARESGGTWNAPLSRAGFSRPQWPPRNDTRSHQATGSRPRNKGEFGELQKKQKQPLGCVYCRCAGSMTSTVAVADAPHVFVCGVEVDLGSRMVLQRWRRQARSSDGFGAA